MSYEEEDTCHMRSDRVAPNRAMFLGGVKRKRLCTYRPSVIYLIVNKLFSLSLSLSLGSPSLRMVTWQGFRV